MLVQLVRRHRVVFAIACGIGLVAGIGFTILLPPLMTSKVLVDVPGTRDITTEAVIADSDPVLAEASRLDPAMSFSEFRRRVKVGSITGTILSISVSAGTAAEAEKAANAVAHSFVEFSASAASPGGTVGVDVLESATPATGSTLAVRLAETALAGLVLGGLAGVISAAAIGRADPRLWRRDEVAAAIGAPVLASIPVVHPTDTVGWANLLEDYQPGAVAAWGLRKALRNVGVTEGTPVSASLAVVSLSTDRGALAVAPQIAVFAASLGIPTTLVIGPQQDTDATAALSAACTMSMSASAGPPSYLRFALGDHQRVDRRPGELTVVVLVVDSRNPRLAPAVRPTATLLGVSAGAATAEQLARVALSTAGSGCEITGIVVADPDPADRTTGRLPELGQLSRPRQPQHRPPARITGTSAESRR